MICEQGPVGIYLHFPFCVQKCRYCDFLSGPADASVRRSYADALCREIRAFGAESGNAGGLQGASKPENADCPRGASKPENAGCPRGASWPGTGEKLRVDTIFLGGGTPSVMDPEDLSRVMDTVRGTFHVLPDAEVSMEMNPGTFREELLSFVKKYINRVSLGLQSTEDAELRTLGRIHTFAEFEDAYRAVREAGCANVNVDLMSAIPGQTVLSWERSLRRIASMAPEHISSYSLIVEEGTPFYALYEAGKLDLPDEDAEREMYYLTERILGEYGYHRYEISNYAKPGCECRHNARYWRRSPYIGFGIGAASLFDETRWSNTRSLEKYLAHSDKKDRIREDVTELSLRERMEEFMFLGLRMTEGVSAERFAACFGRELPDVFGDAVARLMSEGLLLTCGDRYMLTSRGIDVSNVALAEFV